MIPFHALSLTIVLSYFVVVFIDKCRVINTMFYFFFFFNDSKRLAVVYCCFPDLLPV